MKIESLGNEFLAVKLEGILYMKDLNIGGMSLTNQLGREPLLSVLIENFHAFDEIIYLDSEGEAAVYWEGEFSPLADPASSVIEGILEVWK